MDLHPILQGKEEGWGILFTKVGYKVNERHAKSQIKNDERANIQAWRDFSPVHQDFSPHRGFSPPMDISSHPPRIKCYLIWLYRLFIFILLQDFVFRCYMGGRKLSPLDSVIQYICKWKLFRFLIPKPVSVSWWQYAWQLIIFGWNFKLLLF